MFVGAEQCLVGQKQSRGKQFLRRFLAKKSRSSVEQQRSKIIEECFEICLQKGFREGNRNSKGACSFEGLYRQRNPDPSFAGAAIEEGERDL